MGGAKAAWHSVVDRGDGNCLWARIGWPTAGTGATERAAVAVVCAPVAAAEKASRPVTAAIGIAMRDTRRAARDLARDPPRPEEGSALLRAGLRGINCMSLLYKDRTGPRLGGPGRSGPVTGQSASVGPPPGQTLHFYPTAHSASRYLRLRESLLRPNSCQQNVTPPG